MERKEFLDKMALATLGVVSAGGLTDNFVQQFLEPGDRETRHRRRFDDDWRFHLGDIKKAENPEFDANSWRQLNLPHDWSIEQDFSKDAPAGAKGGALPGGIGWYRKAFKLSESKKDKQFFIEFYGAYENSDVWINGHHVGNRPYGYSTFRYDMSPYLNFGDKVNKLAARVDNSKQPNSRWYSGSGINRHVWLIETSKIHVAHWGTDVTTPSINNRKAEASIQTTIKNDSLNDEHVRLKTIVFDPGGKEVARVSHQKHVKAGAAQQIEQYLNISDPILWSPAAPKLYKSTSIIEKNGEPVDHYHTPFGIRYFRFDGDSGFYLNGKPLEIRGVCDHHNCLGPLGSAQNLRAIARRLELLKDMGCNAFRTSHNPPTPELLELADRMGFLVMDEAFDCWNRGKRKYDYHIYWDDWHKRDLEDMIKRDRNHPSIIMWSIGNEIPEQNHPEGRGIARELAGIVRKLDQTRPVTSGCNHPKPGNSIIESGALDIIGINYHHDEYQNLPAMFAGQKFIGSENTSALATRGHYDMPADEIRIWPTQNRQGMNGNYTCSSYDNCRVPWGATHEENLKAVQKYDYMSGMFVWTGFDYMGEPTPYGWPARSSYFGILDLCGMPKDAYYFYQSQWTDEPMLHLLPHWNWEKGQQVDVWAYSNCDAVELFLNGKPLGTRYVDRGKLHVSWKVDFEPGTLKAVGKQNGTSIITQKLRTAGNSANIRLTPDRDTIRADGRDLSYVTVEVTDEQGILVPHANDKMNFEVSGPGTIAGIGNGHQISHQSFQSPHHRVFNGKCLVIVQSQNVSGDVTLGARAKRLNSSSLTFKTT